MRSNLVPPDACFGTGEFTCPIAAGASPATSCRAPTRNHKPLLCLLAAVGFFQIPTILRADVTLALQGYCHANRYMPVRVDENPVELKAMDSLPTFAAAGTSRVVPVMTDVAGDDLIAGSKRIRLKPIGEDEKLIAIFGRASDANAKRLFPGARAVTVPIDRSIFTSPPAAWQSLDGLLLDAAGAAELDDIRRGALLAEGVTLAVKSIDAPDRQWPWTRHADLWILHAETAGLSGSLVEAEAFGPVSAVPPGLSSRERRTLAAATLVLLAVLIVARLVPWPVRFLCVVTLLTLAFAAGWRRTRPAVVSGEGAVVVRSGALQQQDTWLYELGRVERLHGVPWSGFARPVLPSDESLTAANLKLVDDGSLRFEYRTLPHRSVAVLKSEISPTMPIAAGAVSSPMRILANDVYVRPGLSISGIHQVASGWPSVLLDDVRQCMSVGRGENVRHPTGR